MRKIYIIFFALIFAYSYAQSIDVEYENTISDISSVKEHLYILKTDIISVKDSVIVFKNNSKLDVQSRGVRTKETIYQERYLKNLSSNIVGVYVYENNNPYFISDIVPKINWKINYDVKKNIEGYTCYQATSNFRGSNIVAFFTKQIPYSTGPYKFSGLPGLILEIYEKDKNYNHWKATKINLDSKKEIPKFDKSNFKQISLKAFVKIKERANNELFEKLTSKLPPSVKIQRERKRYGIEKKYEWE